MNAKRRTTAPALRTAKQARQWLIDNGLSVTAFAEANGLSRDAVNNALRSSCKRRIGKTHDAAVALGMKAVAPDSHTDLQRTTRIRTVKATSGKAPVKKAAAKKAAGKKAIKVRGKA
jgi:gp16 family phage-associated protein